MYALVLLLQNALHMLVFLLCSRFCTWKSRKWTMNNVRSLNMLQQLYKIFSIYFTIVCACMRVALCIYVYTCGLICHCVNSCCTTTWSAIVMLLLFFFFLLLEKCCMWPQTVSSFVIYLFSSFLYKSSSTIPISVYYCCFGRPLLLSFS